MKQVSLFSGVTGLEEYDKMARKVKNKRVHYKNVTYTKVYKNDVIEGKIHNDDVFVWGRMRELNQRLSNFFPVFFNGIEPTEQGEDYRFFDFGIVRVWDNTYTSEKYIYKGDTYKGQDFKVLEAEIIGTEDLGITERLFIHECVLEALEDGYQIEQLNWWIEEMVNIFKSGQTASNLVLAMIMEGAKNPPNLDRKEEFMI